MVNDLKIIIFFKLILEILFIHHQNYLIVARISKTTILIPSALIFIVWESFFLKFFMEKQLLSNYIKQK